VIATYCSPVLSARPLIGILATILGIVSGWNLGWLFQGRQRFRTPIMLEVLGFAISLVLILSLVGGPADSSWVLGSLLVAGVVSSVIAYGMTVFEIGSPVIRWKGVPQLFRHSTMLFCYSTGSVVLTASSTYLLTLLSTSSQVGYFGAAERFATIGLSLMGPAGQVFIPTITRQLAEDDHTGARMTTRRGASGWRAGAVTVAAAIDPRQGLCAERICAAMPCVDVSLCRVQSVRGLLRAGSAQ
jgi:O-antigen/teichoic acid export membrane protein